MKVLVCGGRDYADELHVFDVLDELWRDRAVEQVIHGGASGADSLARRWANYREVPHVPYPADWMRYGPAAGPLRNQRMLDHAKPDLVVAFPGGTGTADMVRRAKAARVEVLEVAT